MTTHARMVLALLLLAAAPLQAQQGQQGALQRAGQLDRDGRTADARALIQAVIDSASTPLARAQAQRFMALSYAFDGNCAKTIEYEQQVIAYWKTREEAEPQNAFYQQGEMANEGARICIDAGDLDAAETWYRRGYELGMKEPAPRTHPASLWEYRLAHALARIAARRGNSAEAQRQIALARKALDGDSAMAVQQERFFPYLVGYVALYTGDLAKAQAELEKTVAMRGNDRDPFFRYLLGLTHEKLGHADVAKTHYEQALALATGHNPPAAYVQHALKKK